jgi:starch-binding outer membrane protein, SusD/RagB family
MIEMKRVLSKYMRVFAVLGVALGSAACTDLTEKPITEITEEDFKPTEQDLAALMGGVYENMRGWFMGWYGYVDVMEESGDVLLTPQRPNGWVDGGVYRFRHEHNWNVSRGSMSDGWNRSYSLITEANRLLNMIETDFIPLSPASKTAAVAEMRALRAYAYSILLDHFGRVPISTDFADASLPQQSTRQQTYDFVVQELTQTLPNLSDVTGTAMYGRMNKWAALGILARVHLNAQVYTGTPAWDQAIAAADQVINSGKFSLAADYRAPFARNNNTSSEIILAVPYDAVSAGGSNFHMKTLKPDLEYALKLNAQPWGGSAANPQFIDTYDATDTRKADSWLMGPVYSADNRGYTFVKHVPGMTSISGLAARTLYPEGADSIVQFGHGFPVWKYEIYVGETGSSDVDYPILRYAEVLMTKAEALLRKGDAAGAAILVTQVRQRAFKADPSKATVTGAQLMGGSAYNYGFYHRDGTVRATSDPASAVVTNGGADIAMGRFLDELGWEFAVEGHRRSQLIRFGVFTTKTWFNHVADAQRLASANHLLLLPIPQNRLDQNRNLTQNPGY